MKKLYYTDPLIAAYMAREFGVKFRSNMTERAFDFKDFSYVAETYLRGDGVAIGWWGYNDDISSTFYIYIHPDSLPIFDPKEGDKDEDGYIYEEKKLAWFRKDGLYDDEPVYGYRHSSVIAKRDNKVFFTPEVEA